MDQNSKVQKFLPLGTVVLLKNGKKKIMITGYCCVGEEHKDKMFDYAGCMYPEGIISSKQSLMFNHEDIDKVYYVGYVDEESNLFTNKLIEIEKNIEEKLKES